MAEEGRQKWITKKDPKDKKITNTLKKAAKKLMETLYSIPSLATLPITLAKTLRNITQKKAEDKGVEWITKVQKQLGESPGVKKSPEPDTKVINWITKKPILRGKKLGERAKGGIVQKFSKGGTVERPRGVGIAKRGYGKVMR